MLATARYPERAGGLSVTGRAGRGERLEIAVGEDVLAGTTRAGCPHVLRLAGSRWSLVTKTGRTSAAGILEQMPIVTGLFSELDLGTGDAPSVVVDTGVNASRTISRQAIAWIVAVMALAGALVLVAFGGPPGRPTGFLRRAAGAARGGRRRRRAGARRLVGALARLLGRRLGLDARANVRIRARLLELLRLTRGIPSGRLLARVDSALADSERRGATRAATTLAHPACGDVGALSVGVLAARIVELSGALGARSNVSRRRSGGRDDTPPRAGDRVLRRRRARMHGSFPGA